MNKKQKPILIAVAALAIIGIGFGLYRASLPKPDLSKQQIYNLEYYLHGFIVPFVDGHYSYGDNPSDSEYARSEIERYVLGDLDNDKDDDAVVIIEEDNGDAGSLVYLTAVINEANAPKSISDSAILGEQADIKVLKIENGRVVLEMVGFDDESGTEKRIVRHYLLDDDILQEDASNK